MSKVNPKTILGFSFILFGILSLINDKLIKLNYTEILGIVLGINGIALVYFSLSRGKRNTLILSTIIFLVGIIFFVKSYFNIAYTNEIVFISILFISGAVLLMLFIENSKEKAFLYSGLILTTLAFVLIVIINQIGFLQIGKRVLNITVDFLPIILILFGLDIFLRRNN